MTYKEAVDFLYEKLPMFTRDGPAALKPGLDNIRRICEALANPHQKFKSIHIAGTNGKGSTSHMLASILQCSGYKTGLYTSPHLKSFTERIRINGVPIPESEIVAFVESNKKLIEAVEPSFFEMTTAMAFKYFADHQVDIAIIETGLGGRLDATNIILPMLSIITNIGWDHSDILGKSLGQIAAEKAGIIKNGIDVIINETLPETIDVFLSKAILEGAPVHFTNNITVVKVSNADDLLEVNILIDDEVYLSRVKCGVQGHYQLKNIKSVIKTVILLQQKGYSISTNSLIKGLLEVNKRTGLYGRWQILSNEPLTICDTAHNSDGIKEVMSQLNNYTFHRLHLIIGMVKDKDLMMILKLFPIDAAFYFCQAKIPRAKDAYELAQIAQELGILGKVIPDVNDAIAYVKTVAAPTDLIFIGGSTFVVAEISNL